MATNPRGGARAELGRRRIVAGALAAAALTLGNRAVRAQVARSGLVRLVVGFTAGGSADRVARALAPELTRLTGRSVIVENIVGANSARGIARVAASEPNGDILLFATSAIAHPDNSAAMEALRPVIVTSTTPMVLVVRASLPVRSPAEFARWLVAHPGATYGSAGIGNGTHLCAAELVDRLGAEAIHVPYTGAPPAFADLLGDRIDFMTMGANASAAQHAGARMLAVSTRTRSKLPAFDQLPTLAETIAPGFDFSLWQAVYAPSRLPDAAVAELNLQFRTILALDSVRAALVDAGAEVVSGSPEDAERFYRAEVARFRKQTQR